jgi:hypothetical protein
MWCCSHGRFLILELHICVLYIRLYVGRGVKKHRCRNCRLFTCNSSVPVKTPYYRPPHFTLKIRLMFSLSSPDLVYSTCSSIVDISHRCVSSTAHSCTYRADKYYITRRRTHAPFALRVTELPTSMRGNSIVIKASPGT